MRLLCFGGDERMRGALEAARASGWEARHIRCEEDVKGEPCADAVMLPWPRSFDGETLCGGELTRERTLALLPPCRVLLAGGGLEEKDAPQAERIVRPAQDEAFLLENAKLTAEGAIAAAVRHTGRALLGKTCVVTGFGRIARALTARLCAMEAFVIVCARIEAQMRLAHELGAHPVPMTAASSACAQADVVFDAVPSRVLGEAALSALPSGAWVIELASPPYGLDVDWAVNMGVQVAVEGGLPGRYAPMDAGAALFAALCRAMDDRRGGKESG